MIAVDILNIYGIILTRVVVEEKSVVPEGNVAPFRRSWQTFPRTAGASAGFTRREAPGFVRNARALIN